MIDSEGNGEFGPWPVRTGAERSQYRAGPWLPLDLPKGGTPFHLQSVADCSTMLGYRTVCDLSNDESTREVAARHF